MSKWLQSVIKWILIELYIVLKERFEEEQTSADDGSVLLERLMP